MSISGKYVWTGDDHRIYARDFSTRRDLGCYGHADMAISAEGREVIVCGGQYFSPDGQRNLGTWLMMVDVTTGGKTWLAPLSKGEGVYHISGNSHDRPGWALVSVYGPTFPGKPTDWAQHSIFMVELTNRIKLPDIKNHSRVWRIAHSHTLRKDYADDPFAKINKKGTKIWFGSGWGNSYKDGQYDVYQIDLPQNWDSAIKGDVGAIRGAK
jgi:hypothetical protein